jgi:Flp pilus assembly protein TadG
VTHGRGRTTRYPPTGPGPAGNFGDPATNGKYRSWIGNERGDGGGSALVWLLLVPLLLTVVFFGIQAAENGYARSIAQAAAEAGVRAAVSAPGDPARAEPAAEKFLADNAGSHLREASVSVSTDGVLVTVTVTGMPASVFPGGTGALTRTASGPLELLGQGAVP